MTESTKRHLVRVWLPDRPGSLGVVASAVGEAGGDVEGVDILESGAGRAVDELLIGGDDIDTVVAALVDLDGVDVEWVKLAEVGDGGPDLEALEGAAGIASLEPAEQLAALVGLARRTTSSSWVAVVGLGTNEVLASEGHPPAPAWIAAFVAGSRYADHDGEGVDDVCWADLGVDSVLVLGREGHPFRHRERRRVRALSAAFGALSGVLN